MIESLRFLQSSFAAMPMILLAINIILHILFAGAVAKDAGNIQRLGQKPALVNGVTWAFATLAGGIWVAAIYWFIHHSKLTRD